MKKYILDPLKKLPKGTYWIFIVAWFVLPALVGYRNGSLEMYGIEFFSIGRFLISYIVAFIIFYFAMRLFIIIYNNIKK